MHLSAIIMALLPKSVLQVLSPSGSIVSKPGLVRSKHTKRLRRILTGDPEVFVWRRLRHMRMHKVSEWKHDVMWGWGNSSWDVIENRENLTVS